MIIKITLWSIDGALLGACISGVLGGITTARLGSVMGSIEPGGGNIVGLAVGGTVCTIGEACIGIATAAYLGAKLGAGLVGIFSIIMYLIFTYEFDNIDTILNNIHKICYNGK